MALWNWIKSLFGSHEVSPVKEPDNLFQTRTKWVEPQKSDNSFNQANGMIAPKANTTPKSDIRVEHQRILANLKTTSPNNLNHQEIVQIIQTNTFYLEKLADAMSRSIYVTEYEKVKQLLQQSQNCLKLIKHINQSQIFYKNTTNFIIAHAMQVGKLTEHLKNVELE